MTEPTNYLEKVPTLPFEVICQKSEVLTMADVLDLSLTTENLKEQVYELKLKIVQLDVAFDRELSYIYLKTAHDMSLKWEFHQTLPEGHGKTTIRKIAHHRFRSIKTASGISTDHYNIEDGIPAVLKYFVSIFDFSNWEIDTLSIDMSVIAEFRVLCDIFRTFRKINKLVLTRSGTEPFNPLLCHNIRDFLEKHDFEHVYMGVNTDFDVHFNNTAHHRFQKLLSVDHVNIVSAEWISPDDLLNFNVKTLIIGQENLIKAEDLNAFIKNWLESESTKLMWLKVNTDKKLDSDVVLEGLTLEATRRVATIVKCPFHCSSDGTIIPLEWPGTSRQLTRPDGSIATIAIKDEFFFFHVTDSGPQPVFPETPQLQRRANGPLQPPMNPVDMLMGIDLRAVRRRMNDLRRGGEHDGNLLRRAMFP